MTINQALVSLVLANTAITSVIGQRFTPALALDGKILPAATYQRISGRHVESMGGSSGLCFARYQVNTMATTAKVAKQLGKLIRVCLHGYAGTVSGLEIQGVTWDSDGDLLDPSPDLEAARVYGYRNDFLIHYTEAIPA